MNPGFLIFEELGNAHPRLFQKKKKKLNYKIK